MILEDVNDRHLGNFILGLQRAERRGLFHAHADPEADANQKDRDQERNAPAIAHEVFFGQLRHQREHADGREIADGIADLHHAAQEAAFMRGTILDHHQHRATPFAAKADALQEAQRDEQDRRRDSNLCIGRQQTDRESAETHHHDRNREHRLAADAVAIVTEDRRTERTREEADRIGTEGCDSCECRIAGSEEHLVEHQRGCRAVDQEVIPLDGGADHTGPDDLAHGRIVGISAVAVTVLNSSATVMFTPSKDMFSFRRVGSFRAATSRGAVGSSRELSLLLQSPQRRRW